MVTLDYTLVYWDLAMMTSGAHIQRVMVMNLKRLESVKRLISTFMILIMMIILAPTALIFIVLPIQMLTLFQCQRHFRS